MNFLDACRAMDEGHSVRHQNWPATNSRGQKCFLKTVQCPIDPIGIEVFGNVPYAITTTEYLSDKWEIID